MIWAWFEHLVYINFRKKLSLKLKTHTVLTYINNITRIKETKYFCTAIGFCFDKSFFKLNHNLTFTYIIDSNMMYENKTFLYYYTFYFKKEVLSSSNTFFF